jgi:hypothetical protein
MSFAASLLACVPTPGRAPSHPARPSRPGRLCALALALCAAMPAGAAEPGAPAEDRLRTVILGLLARRGVEDPKLAAALTDVVQGVYATDARRITIGRDDIARVLDLEADKQAMGCDTDKCLAEVGQALDAARIVTGSLDKLGDGFMVTMSEIDAKTLEPIARGQERVRNDENELVEAVQRLATDLVHRAGLGSASRLFGNAGSVEIASDPRGARIILSGTEMGVTPTKIDNVATGTQKLRLIRDDYEPVEVEVPVYAGGTTKVTAEMRILRALAEKNLEVRQATWRDKNQWHTVGGWTKAGIGTLLGGAGALYAITNLAERDRGPAVGGAIVGGVGGAVLAWGVLDLLNPPAPPVAEWEIERKVTVKPPAGHGEETAHVIQEARGPGLVRE